MLSHALSLLRGLGPSAGTDRDHDAETAAGPSARPVSKRRLVACFAIGFVAGFGAIAAIAAIA